MFLVLETRFHNHKFKGSPGTGALKRDILLSTPKIRPVIHRVLEKCEIA